MTKKIPINMPQIGKEEIQLVTKVLKSHVLTGRVGSGPMATQFEKDFAKFAKAKNAVAVNSGTAALHMAVLTAKIRKGDEVITPSFTFVATAESVALVGAKPVFVDVDLCTYNIDPEKVESVITNKTKAIIAVDLYGLPAATDTLKEIAERHDLVLIEDAAQAHGALLKDKPVGYFADMACWSFYASKNMTTGEGGMITTNKDEYASILRSLRSHGETKEYVSNILGHNYRMPEIEAAIGVAQLKKLPAFIEKRKNNAKMLTQLLKGTRQLYLPNEPKGYRHAWYLYTVRIQKGDAAVRDKIVKDLAKQGVGAAVYYPVPIHLMPYYREFGEYNLPNTQQLASQTFSLPVHPGLTAKDTDHVAKSVKQTLRRNKIGI